MKIQFPQVMRTKKKKSERTSLNPVLVLGDHSMTPTVSSGSSPDLSIRSSNNMMHREGSIREQPPYVMGEMLFLLGVKPEEAILVPIRKEDGLR